MNLPDKHTGPWTLKQLFNGELGQPRNGLKVMSTFSCGGGSSMGYKLAGYDVVACVEIDKAMFEMYMANLKPKFGFNVPIQQFNQIPNSDLPHELFELDVLDGSPPCSVFSLAGKRDEGWGVEKKFREGQAEQRLDDLFFHFIETAEKLKPKFVVAENVTGMLVGAARGYLKEIFKAFDDAGYDVRLFELDASQMGVPQKRRRIFFVGSRKDLNFENTQFDFNERSISVSEAWKNLNDDEVVDLMKPKAKSYKYWSKTIPGRSFCDAASVGENRNSGFTNYRLSLRGPAPTLTSAGYFTHPVHPRTMTKKEICRIQSFPDDYFFSKNSPQYVCGMSVPPLMMQRIAIQVAQSIMTRVVVK